MGWGQAPPCRQSVRRANSASSRGKATECFLEGLRVIVSFANGYGKQSQVLMQLFECSKDVELSQGEVDEVGEVLLSKLRLS